MPDPRALMFQGTGSDVGKSTVVAGLCRVFARRGIAVRPFKPQNMSNNAAVTADGGEIGRAQAMQAWACGIAPTVHMNPVLLKPDSDTGAQVVVQGRVLGRRQAGDYQGLRPDLMPAVLDSFRRVGEDADLVLVEGAGSPAEINLRAGDIANMGFARAAGIRVVLVADIDRGGVIASVVGTKAVLDGEDAALVTGFLVNKFRGDPCLFDAGLLQMVERTGWRSYGVLPWLPACAALAAEDAVVLDRQAAVRPRSRRLRIVAPMLSRLANFDDLDPLAAEPDVEVLMIPPGVPLPGDADLVVLLGTKATVADLVFLREQGWDIDLRAHVRRGGRVLGLCGGYQMLGHQVSDPLGLEGGLRGTHGLGLLDVETTLGAQKIVRQVDAHHLASGAALTGYEIHAGMTTGPATSRPWLRFADRVEGAMSPDGNIVGCYVHGLFVADGFRRAFLAELGGASEGQGLGYQARVNLALDALADGIEEHCNVDELWAAALRLD